MFSKSAELYDTIYLSRGKAYAAEAQAVHELVQKHLHSGGKTLLDVACGTGIHTGYLRQHYQVEGLDLDERMLEVARKKMPEITFHQGDMLDFELPRKFDVITCLFSSIGYVKTLPKLNQAVANLERHLKPGGVIIVEPWFTPADWHPGRVHATFVDQPDLKIARMNLSGQDGTLSYFVFHYLVATLEGITCFDERHELGLFTTDEYLAAFRTCGLEIIHDPRWLNERGLYLGQKTL
jgi:ubiquinone/menaquinone biosynthesis C-methylase UbiE